MAWRMARSLLRGRVSPRSARAAAPASVPAHPLPSPRTSGIWTRSFVSLTNANFRWFFLAMVGHWGAQNMQMLIRGYLVYDLTGSYAALGVMSLANAFPMLTLSIVGGILADRFDKKKVLQIGQILSMGLSIAVAILLLSDVLRFWHLLVAGAVQGSIMAISMPARQSMIPNLVRREWLMNAISLNAAGMNLLRLIAPAIAGVMIDVTGSGSVYVLMSVLYGAAIVTLIPVRTYPNTLPLPAGNHREAPARPSPDHEGRHGERRGSRSLSDLWDGFLYIRHHSILGWLLLINFGISLLAMPYLRLLPGFVADVFSDSGSVLGALIAINGAGALAGALFLAGLPNRRRGMLLIGSAAVIGVGLIALAVSGSVALAAFALIVVGVGTAGRQALSSVLLQTHTEEAYRGRVMAVYMMEVSMVSFGAFIMGVLTEVIGPQEAFAGLGIVLLFTSLAGALFIPAVRRLD